MSVLENILKLKKQLYPTGRAFKMPPGGPFEKLNNALNQSEAQAYADAKSILNSILPDNDDFLEDDATAWERRLGLITNSAVSLADRKLAIKRKLNYPTGNPAKQHYLYLQTQLQAAGFDVYVFENRFDDYPNGYITKTPIEVSGAPSILSPFQHGQRQHGNFQHGGGYNNKVVNHIDESLDRPFSIGTNYRSTFFVGGNTVGSFAEIPVARKTEFRQLILRLKPVQTVAFLFINYI